MDLIAPACLTTERQLLGALLVALWPDRDRITRDLQRHHFHDEWNGKAAMLLKTNKQTARPWVKFPRCDRSEVASLLVRRDGTSCCGLVSELPKLVAKLKRLSKLRAKQLMLLHELAGIQRAAEKEVT